MNTKHLIFALFLMPLFFANFAFAATTTPSAVFSDYRYENKSIIFDILMPYGNNGNFVFLLQNESVVASSSLASSTPFAQAISLKHKISKDGQYEYKVLLCNNSNMSECSYATPISLISKNNELIDESDINEDDISVSRKDLLNERASNRYKSYIYSELTRLNNIKIAAPYAVGKQDNIVRVRKIFSETNLSSILSATQNYSFEDFYSLIARYPAFCNEAKSGVSKEVACKMDLSAYFSILLYYTNDEIKNDYLGINNKVKLNELFGDNVMQNAEESEIFEKVMDLYMKSKNPEPSMHEVVLSLYLPNKIDRLSGIENGFGAVINIASHGNLCGGKNTVKSKQLSDLYKRYLTRAKITDSNNVSCEKQKPFSINSSSYIPQYVRYDVVSEKCILDIVESGIEEKRCNLSTLKLSDDVIDAAAKKANAERVRLRALPISSKPVDARTVSLDKIIATYPFWRAYEDNSNISNIPLHKVNSLMFEGLTVDQNANIKFIDEYVSNYMPFAGDCLQATCNRGITNQLKKAKEAYPKLKIYFDIKVNDFQIFKNKTARDAFENNIYKILDENSYVDGVNINIISIKDKAEGELLRSVLAKVKSQLSAINAKENTKHLLSISFKEDEDLINNINFKDSVSMIDLVILQAYDNHTPVEEKIAHGAQMISSPDDKVSKSMISGLELLNKLGVKEDKIIIGVPFYGRVWSDVKEVFGSKQPPLFGTHKSDAIHAYIPYKTIADYFLLKGKYQYYEDKDRGASYLYDGNLFISYDSPEIIAKKLDYLIKNKYRGVLVADILSDNGSLIDKTLNSIQKENSTSTCKIKRQIKNAWKEGDRGADVYAVQEYLKCLSYLPSHIEINGFFGSITKNALIEFQKDNKLNTSGFLDESTIKSFSR